MINRVTFLIFWIVFAGFFLFFLYPSFSYVTKGFPDYMPIHTTARKVIFATHIISGVIVYSIAFFQFAPFIRNKHINLHRWMGRVYVAVSLLCIASLYYIITLGKEGGLPFWPSQYTATTLWLVFIFLAIYSIRQDQVKWHRRFMISGFICAAYFVTVRIVDRFCMALFKAVFPDQGTALLISDLFVWAFPLVVCWTYWLL